MVWQTLDRLSVTMITIFSCCLLRVPKVLVRTENELTNYSAVLGRGGRTGEERAAALSSGKVAKAVDGG